jgi:hypothetical protein
MPDASITSDGGSVQDATSELGESVEALIACALGRAETCRSADAGDAGNANWSSVLLGCAGELGF